MFREASIVILFCMVARSSALFEDFSLDEGDVLMNSQELGRTFGSFNISALTGGATIDGMSILKVALILLLFKILYGLALGRNIFSRFTDRAYDGVYQNRRDSYYYDDYNDDQFSSRRSDDFQEDFATLMHNLEQAFKKYNVHETECQMYVACEAAQLDRQDENGPLAKIVYDIINTMVSRHDFSEVKLNQDMDGVTQAFIFGRDAERFGKEDACAPLRSKCFELQDKKHHNNYNYF